MSTLVRCDTCKEQEKLSGTLKPWIAVTFTGKHQEDRQDATFHFCDSGCLMAFAEKEATERVIDPEIDRLTRESIQKGDQPTAEGLKRFRAVIPTLKVSLLKGFFAAEKRG